MSRGSREHETPPINPYAGGAPPRRWGHRLATLNGGLLFTAGVFLFLAWIQPVHDANERIDLPPTFRFKVDPTPPPSTQEPQREDRQSPKKPVREKQPEKKLVKRTAGPRKAVRRDSASSSLRSGVRSSVGRNVDLGAGLGTGGGPALTVGEDFTAMADEVQDLLDYNEQRNQIRNMRQRAENEAGPPRAKGIAKDAQRINDPEPPYPPRAKQKGVGGVVQFRALVGRDGTIEEFEIIQANPPGYFEEAVEKYVIPRMRFRPAEDEEGRPIESWETINYRFRLKDA